MINVVYGIDDKYLPCLLVSVYTTLKTTTDPIKITVFKVQVQGGGKIYIDDSKIEQIVNKFPNADLTTHCFESSSLKEYAQADVAMRLPSASMVPLFVPWLIDGKCIFLDADTLILKDLSLLFKIDLKENLIGATNAWHVRKYLFQKNQIFCLREIGNRQRFEDVRKRLFERASKMNFSIEDLERKYFSSGVLLFDTKAIRSFDPTAELMDLNASKKHWTGLPDMDRLNEFFKDRVLYLDLKWNVYKDVSTNRRYLPENLLKQVKAATRDPCILHYGGFYDSTTWSRPWYKMRKRFRIFERTCHEIKLQTGIDVFQMFNSRVGCTYTH